MKQRLYRNALLSALLVQSLPTFANSGHGPSGCGLGSEVIFRNADEWHEHVMAATTNLSGSQTLAMTSGTLGCEDANGPLKNGIALFLDNNIEQLAADTAIGQGETLSALSELIGISSDDQTTFNKALKNNFDQIFSSEEVTSGQAYDALVSVMIQDITLSKYVNRA